ncbi:hypothetical protein ACOZ4I_17660 (plasmid) [Haloarcula salina]|uniref:hypothetical protein n=1 Tax=Haloarcula salina TaxID=1429914 RepID=UPI003C6FEA24
MGLLQSTSKVVLKIDILFLVLLVFSLYNLDPGTGSYVAATLSLLPVTLTLAGVLAVIYTGWEPFE